MNYDKETCKMLGICFHETSTVQSNVCIFAIHAAFMPFIYIVQISIYNSSSFELMRTTMVLLFMIIVPCLLWCGLLEYGIWLDYFCMASFFKICCTLTKYSKQFFHNYRRKSTAGWNIWYKFLEFTEGFLSLVQIVLDSYMKGGRSGIIGNLAVFLLGIATIVFDSIFLVNEVSIDGFSIHTVAVSKINLMESQTQEIHA
mmetsp:Transcript_15607/g.22828  ORF Transcript_15607/g.22828 Transcript_15607/m.22828 type:complete len:200 (-) Transcript_15607:966-1565(-)